MKWCRTINVPRIDIRAPSYEGLNNRAVLVQGGSLVNRRRTTFVSTIDTSSTFQESIYNRTTTVPSSHRNFQWGVAILTQHIDIRAISDKGLDNRAVLVESCCDE